MRKISLFKTLALLGVVALTSVCVTETVLLLKHTSPDAKQEDSLATIDLSNYNNYFLSNILESNNIPDNSAILGMLKEYGIKSSPTSSDEPITFDNINDLVVVGAVSNNSFIITCANNSSTYISSKTATISYITPTSQNLTDIITSAPKIYLNEKYEDDELTKSYILTNLQTQYPTLNINQLNCTINNEKDIIISSKPNSMLYSGSIGGTYYTSGSVILTYSKNTLSSGDTNVAPTFKYHGETISTGVTYSTTYASPITFSATGIFGYTSGIAFVGAAYVVSATYVNGIDTFVAYATLVAQPFSRIASLSIPNSNITLENKTSGTPVFTLNGAVVTPTYTISPSLPANQGLTFTNGILTWDNTYYGTTACLYTIIATYSVGTSVTATTQVLVTENSYGAKTVQVRGISNSMTNYIVITGINGSQFATIDIVGSYNSSASSGIIATFAGKNGMSFISGGQQSSTSLWQYRSLSSNNGLCILVKNAWDTSRQANITIKNGGFEIDVYVTTEAQTGTFTDVPYLYR